MSAYAVTLGTTFLLSVPFYAALNVSADDGSDILEWTDPSPHQSRYVVLDGFRLNYLEWGSGKKTVVIVPGLGDSPHLFDKLGPDLSDGYRVISYARRGHAKSSTPPEAQYDVDTLTDDLRQLMDELDIQSASLIGFSMGGSEANRFAVLYPSRVEKLIYLDSAYDYDSPDFRTVQENWPIDYDKPASAMSSVATYYEWLLTQGWRIGLPRSDALWADTADVVEPIASGGVRKIVDDALGEVLLGALRNHRKDYSSVQAPSLAIYGLWAAEHNTPPDADAEQIAKSVSWVTEYARPFQTQSMERFEREAPNGRVIAHPDTHHVIFLHRPDEITQEIWDFLHGE